MASYLVKMQLPTIQEVKFYFPLIRLMILNNYLSLLSYNNLLMYSECNYILNFSLFAFKKVKMHPIFLFFSNSSSLFFFRSILLNPTTFSYYWSFYYYIFQSFFFSSTNGFFNGFRILGRGYKAYLHLNNFLFRLGYSHNVYYVLPLSFKTQMKEKTQAFWMIRGVEKASLSNIVSLIRSFKLPNTYRHKGIYRIHDNYNVKLTKKSTL